MPRDQVPPYLRVAAEIRAKIESGELVPGDQIPSMAQLSEAYEISRNTARRVLNYLRDQGFVEITPGWGTFVARRTA